MPTGTITLARHGEPAIDRSVRLSAEEYGAFWQVYETVDIKPGQTPPTYLLEAAENAQVIIASTRPRAIGSTQLLTKKDFRRDDRLIEAPLPHPPFPGFIRMRPKMWGFFSRVWWWAFNHTRGQETRPQARVRAAAVAAELSQMALGGDNVLVVAHGYFNAMLGYQLRRLGWRRAWGAGWKYWSTRRYERGP